MTIEQTPEQVRDSIDWARPRPPINSGCFRCGVTNASIDNFVVIVSPTGKAHYGRNDGDTDCGIDATGDRWWWPL